MAERPQIAHVRLEAVSGQEFESGNAARRGDEGTVTLDVPYPGGKPGRLGMLQIAPNIDHLYAAIAGDVLRVLAGFALLTGLICYVVSVILRRQLQLPMQHIAEFAASLKPAELTRPLNLQRPRRRWRDEIDEVADGFRVLQDEVRSHVEELDQLVARRTAELKNANERLEALAHHDPLTGLANRRHFDHERPRAWEQMLSCRHPLSLLMVDIDYFKQYNDTYGHAAGDDCLVTISRTLAECFGSPGELPVRTGGEEFAVLLEAIPFMGAISRAEVVRNAIHALDLPHAKSAHGRVTVSVGVSAVNPLEPPGTLSYPTALSGMVELLGRADEALYQAKAAGRNRVVGLPLVMKASA
jgi:diguanylate cyclase (GGDEF)-like protein